MPIAVDTSVIIAVITNEQHKKRLIRLTQGADLLAPASLHWEVGNALSAMFKRQRITLEQAISSLEAYQQIPLRAIDVELGIATELAYTLKIYAYDAYVIGCALKYNAPLVSLDENLLNAAKQAGVKIIEV